ncbi:hypothetical protein ACLESD_18380 [Pyxidicoccus sp. 3LFB2]
MTKVRDRQNDVVFLGMNKFAASEAKPLNTQGTQVSLIQDAKVDDTITVGTGKAKKTYDLATPGGRKDFVATLGLPAAQSAKLEKILDDAGSDVRDEVGQLAQIWAEGEKGGKVPGRLVLSGHSGGGSIWGHEDGFSNGSLNRQTLTDLAKAMPKAAAQVQDLALSACYCGGESSITGWKEGFPNAKTVLAYHDKSPSGADGGSTSHLKRWEQLTRGDVDALKPKQFEGLTKAKNVATWSVKHGYLTPGAKEKPEVVRQRINDFQPQYAKYFSGETPPPASEPNPLRTHYRDLQDLASRSDVPDAEKARLQGQISQTIRLIKYEGVKGAFQRTHGADVKAGFEAAGLKAPDLSRLSRKEALQQLADLEKATAGKASVPAETKKALELLQKGLRDLDPALIPDNWIG